MECRATMTKAMNINFKKGGDDLFNNRLLSYLSNKLNVKIDSIKQVRGNVYLVHTQKENYILKGFTTLRKLKIQEAFSSSLRKTGFDQSYSFFPPVGNPLYFQNQYFGCLEFIEPHPDPFHYSDKTDREEGAELLNSFHVKTAKLARSYVSLLPRTELSGKWQLRRNEFSSNLPKIHSYINKEITDEYLHWADFALTGFAQFKKNLEADSPVILHGDVAHHNFLRSREGKLYLIDYDLISIGPTAFDMLQYANRILPYLNWKLDSLAEIKHLNKWLSNDAFLYGLLYPADIFREWNRLLRERNSVHHYNAAPIAELTLSQFHEREQFHKEVKSLLIFK